MNSQRSVPLVLNLQAPGAPTRASFTVPLRVLLGVPVGCEFSSSSRIRRISLARSRTKLRHSRLVISNSVASLRR